MKTRFSYYLKYLLITFIYLNILTTTNAKDCVDCLTQEVPGSASIEVSDHMALLDAINPQNSDLNCSELLCEEKIAKSIILRKINEGNPTTDQEFLELLNKYLAQYLPKLKDTEKRKIVASIISKRLDENLKPAIKIVQKHLKVMRDINTAAKSEQEDFVKTTQTLANTIEKYLDDCKDGLNRAKCFLDLSIQATPAYYAKVKEKIEKGSATLQERMHFTFLEMTVQPGKTTKQGKIDLTQQSHFFSVARDRYKKKVAEKINRTKLSGEDKKLYLDEFNQQINRVGLNLTNQTGNLFSLLKQGQAELQLAAKTLGAVGFGVASGGIGLKLLSTSRAISLTRAGSVGKGLRTLEASRAIAAEKAGAILTTLGMNESALAALVATESFGGYATAGAIEGVTISWLTNLIKKANNARQRENLYCSLITDEINDQGFISDIAIEGSLSALLGGAASSKNILIQLGVMGVGGAIIVGGTAMMAVDINSNLKAIKELKTHVTSKRDKACLDQAKKQVIQNGAIDIGSLVAEIGISSSPAVIKIISKSANSRTPQSDTVITEKQTTLGSTSSDSPLIIDAVKDPVAKATEHVVKTPETSKPAEIISPDNKINLEEMDTRVATTQWAPINFDVFIIQAGKKANLSPEKITSFLEKISEIDQEIDSNSLFNLLVGPGYRYNSEQLPPGVWPKDQLKNILESFKQILTSDNSNNNTAKKASLALLNNNLAYHFLIAAPVGKQNLALKYIPLESKIKILENDALEIKKWRNAIDHLWNIDTNFHDASNEYQLRTSKLANDPYYRFTGGVDEVRGLNEFKNVHLKSFEPKHHEALLTLRKAMDDPKGFTKWLQEIYMECYRELGYFPESGKYPEEVFVKILLKRAVEKGFSGEVVLMDKPESSEAFEDIVTRGALIQDEYWRATSTKGRSHGVWVHLAQLDYAAGALNQKGFDGVSIIKEIGKNSDTIKVWDDLFDEVGGRIEGSFRHPTTLSVILRNYYELVGNGSEKNPLGELVWENGEAVFKKQISDSEPSEQISEVIVETSAISSKIEVPQLEANTTVQDINLASIAPEVQLRVNEVMKPEVNVTEHEASVEPPMVEIHEVTPTKQVGSTEMDTNSTFEAKPLLKSKIVQQQLESITNYINSAYESYKISGTEYGFPGSLKMFQKNMLRKANAEGVTTVPQNIINIHRRMIQLMVDPEKQSAWFRQLYLECYEQWSKIPGVAGSKEFNEGMIPEIIFAKVLLRRLKSKGFSGEVETVSIPLAPEFFNRYIKEGKLIQDEYFRGNEHGVWVHMAQLDYIAGELKKEGYSANDIVNAIKILVEDHSSYNLKWRDFFDNAISKITFVNPLLLTKMTSNYIRENVVSPGQLKLINGEPTFITSGEPATAETVQSRVRENPVLEKDTSHQGWDNTEQASRVVNNVILSNEFAQKLITRPNYIQDIHQGPSDFYQRLMKAKNEHGSWDFESIYFFGEFHDKFMEEIAQNKLELDDETLNRLLAKGIQLKEQNLPYDQTMSFYLLRVNFEVSKHHQNYRHRNGRDEPIKTPEQIRNEAKAHVDASLFIYERLKTLDVISIPVFKEFDIETLNQTYGEKLALIGFSAELIDFDSTQTANPAWFTFHDNEHFKDSERAQYEIPEIFEDLREIFKDTNLTSENQYTDPELKAIELLGKISDSTHSFYVLKEHFVDHQENEVDEFLERLPHLNEWRKELNKTVREKIGDDSEKINAFENLLMDLYHEINVQFDPVILKIADKEALLKRLQYFYDGASEKVTRDVIQIYFDSLDELVQEKTQEGFTFNNTDPKLVKSFFNTAFIMTGYDKTRLNKIKNTPLQNNTNKRVAPSYPSQPTLSYEFSKKLENLPQYIQRIHENPSDFHQLLMKRKKEENTWDFKTNDLFGEFHHQFMKDLEENEWGIEDQVLNKILARGKELLDNDLPYDETMKFYIKVVNFELSKNNPVHMLWSEELSELESVMIKQARRETTNVLNEYEQMKTHNMITVPFLGKLAIETRNSVHGESLPIIGFTAKRLEDNDSETGNPATFTADNYRKYRKELNTNRASIFIDKIVNGEVNLSETTERYPELTKSIENYLSGEKNDVYEYFHRYPHLNEWHKEVIAMTRQKIGNNEEKIIAFEKVLTSVFNMGIETFDPALYRNYIIKGSYPFNANGIIVTTDGSHDKEIPGHIINQIIFLYADSIDELIEIKKKQGFMFRGRNIELLKQLSKISVHIPETPHVTKETRTNDGQ